MDGTGDIGLAGQDGLALLRAYDAVRAETEFRAAGLSPEDQQLQSMPDASPAKWHRAHTTWFFETFVLLPFAPGYRAFDESFAYLFNSYYVAAGPRHARAARGMLSRPGCARITAYRAHVDAAMAELLTHADAAVAALVRLGLQHEQQHQELLLTDALHAFSLHPLVPAVMPAAPPAAALDPALRFLDLAAGSYAIGHDGAGFCFDNETPRHVQHLTAASLADRPVNNAEFAGFIADGGYHRAAFWMDEGFALARQQGWEAPLYWREDGMEVTLAGLAPRADAAPVRHISWYEADAFARWAAAQWPGARLPLEAEMEAGQALHGRSLRAMSDAVWQWTGSPYRPYPGFAPAQGAIGEYNGKFMINQMVLRGGSLATPPGHARPSYRNFFHPDKRWQFSGLRLARDC